MSDVRTIPLSNGGEAIVDAADYDWLSRWKWKRHRNGYVCRSSPGGKRLILMHRQIMDAPRGIEVDHHNGNRLDNRRANLRTATHAQNGHNKPKQSNNTSGFKGVSWDGGRNQWRASIKADGRHRTLGRFDRIEDAVACYQQAERELAGEFAYTARPDVARALVAANVVFAHQAELFRGYELAAAGAVTP